MAAAGGSNVTIGGDLTNQSAGSFGDGGVSVGNGSMTAADMLTVDGTLTNTGGLLDVVGGHTRCRGTGRGDRRRAEHTDRQLLPRGRPGGAAAIRQR